MVKGGLIGGITDGMKSESLFIARDALRLAKTEVVTSHDGNQLIYSKSRVTPTHIKLQDDRPFLVQ
jgi:hypothetical protein